MAVRNHNALPMYKVNSDLYYEQVFFFSYLSDVLEGIVCVYVCR